MIIGSTKTSKVLKSNKYSKLEKDKIIEINSYKKYFYNYFSIDKTNIYDSYYKLENEAVTYLVIASKSYEIKALQSCFWFVGCFPYLGFYNKKDASLYSEGLKKNNYVTFIRPVYAYSTMGKLNDPILSSFFGYKKHGLANLIFHELFHTVFFVKDEVDLNENLASYFADELVISFFNVNKNKYKKKNSINENLLNIIIKNIKDLQNELIKIKKNNAKIYIELFVKNKLVNTIHNYCRLHKMKKCYYEKYKWNQASMSQFLTYRGHNKKIDTLRVNNKLNIKNYYYYIKKRYKEYKDKKVDSKFREFLLSSPL